MKITTLADARRLVTERSISAASIGDTPFFVSGLEDLVPVRFVSSLRSSDATFPGFDTRYAGDSPDGRPSGERLSIDSILARPALQRWLRSPDVSGVCVWDYDEASEPICNAAGITLLASPRRIVRELEDKVLLQRALGEIGLPTLPHAIIEPGDSVSWGEISGRLGGDVVVQSAANNLNGRCTCRAREKHQFDAIIAHHSNERLKITQAAPCGSFNLTGVVLPDQFVPGMGTTQLVGIPDLIDLPFGYCGNESPVSRWFSEKAIDTAWCHLERLSTFARDRGYRGLLGVDFVVDRNDVPYIVDVNPRMQSSQSLVTATQLENDLPPLILLHILHHVGLDVTVDTTRYWEVARQPSSELSQVVIFHTGEPALGTGLIRPGRYNLSSGEFEAPDTSLRGAVRDTTGIIQRACEEGRLLTPNATMFALQVRGSVLENKTTLQPWLRDFVTSLRRQAVRPEVT